MKIDKIYSNKNIIFDGIKLITPEIFKDERGFFYESWNKKTWNYLMQNYKEIKNFVQDNVSESSQGVIRGLHYQIPPYAHGKLINCIKGEIFDVFVDIRHDSETFGQWAGIILNDKNHQQVWLPEGFAHGFLTLSKKAKVSYKTTSHYNPKSERTIRWNDPNIKIKWPKLSINYLLSQKDLNADFFDPKTLTNTYF